MLLLAIYAVIKLDALTQPRGVHHHDSNGYGVRRRHPARRRRIPEGQAEGSSRHSGGRLRHPSVAHVARAVSEAADRSAGRRLAAAVHDPPPRRARCRAPARRSTDRGRQRRTSLHDRRTIAHQRQGEPADSRTRRPRHRAGADGRGAVDRRAGRRRHHGGDARRPRGHRRRSASMQRSPPACSTRTTAISSRWGSSRRMRKPATAISASAQPLERRAPARSMRAQARPLRRKAASRTRAALCRISGVLVE